MKDGVAKLGGPIFVLPLVLVSMAYFMNFHHNCVQGR